MTSIIFIIIGVYILGFFLEAYLALKLCIKNPDSIFRDRFISTKPEWFGLGISCIFWPVTILFTILGIIAITMRDSEEKKKK